MAVNIDALFQHLMEDPDIIPPEGEDKEDIAMAMARQRAKQSTNNIKALSMASEDRSISKLLAFLKAEGDTEEEKQFQADFRKHDRNFKTHGKKIEAAAKKGKEYEWPKIKAGDIKGDERVGETSYAGKVQRKEWEDAYEFLTLHATKMVDEHEQRIALGTAGGQEVTEDPDDDAPATAPEEQEPKAPVQTRTPKESMGTRGAGLTEEEEKARAGMSREERMAAAKVRAAALGDEQADEAEKELAAREAHHSLTSAVDALSDAAPDVELDYYGNDPDAPFHASRFGNNAKAYHGIHEQYRKEDLAAAIDHHEKPSSQGGAGRSLHSLNTSGKEGGDVSEAEVHSMMGRFFDSQGKQAPTEDYVVSGQRTTNPSQKWFDAHMPDRKTGSGVNEVGTKGVAEWDQYVTDNKLDEASPEEMNTHLHSWLKGRGKNPPTPPKPTPTAEHVDPQVQKDIVTASKGTDPKHGIEAKLSEVNSGILHNPVLTPHQQQLMIEGNNALAEIAGRKAKVTLELPDKVETTKDLLSQWADTHVDAEANGEDSDTQATLAQNLHNATLMHEEAGGDAEAVLKKKGVVYRKVGGEGKDHVNGQYHFQGGGKTWGDLSHKEAIGQTPEGGDEPSTDTPEAQDERQAAFDFDAPPPAEAPPEEEDDIFAQAREADEEDEEEYDAKADYESAKEPGDPPFEQYNAHGNAFGEHDSAAGSGWGGVDPESDHFSPEGEQQGKQGYAHEVQQYARDNHTTDVPLIGGPTGIEPHDDVYEHYGFEGGHMGGNPITLDHLKDYIKEKTGEDAPVADWEGAEEPPAIEVAPEPEADAIPAQLDNLDALKMKHDELALEFKQLQAQEAHAKEQLKKVKGVVSEEVAINAELTELKQEKARVRKAGNEQKAKIAAHPDTPKETPTETEGVKPTEEALEETPTTEPQPESTEGATEQEAPPAEEAGETDREPVGDEAPTPSVDPSQGRLPG